jgi:hypothetical protein
MILASHGIIGSSIGQVDADALAFFARVDTATSTTDFLTTTEKTAINKLVLDLKSNSLWTPMKAIYPMVGGGTGTTAQRQAACSQNLKSSSFTGTFTAGWTFASTGVTPNGTSAFMNTNFIPSANTTITNNHFSLYLPSVPITSNNVYSNDLGVFTGSGTNRFGSNIRNFDGTTFDVRKRTVVNNSSIGNGFYLYTRSEIDSAKVFFNNSLIIHDTSSTNSYGYPNLSVYLGALRFDLTFTTPSNRRNCFATLGDSLTDTQASNFYTAVQAFQTTLSRNV